MSSGVQEFTALSGIYRAKTFKDVEESASQENHGFQESREVIGEVTDGMAVPGEKSAIGVRKSGSPGPQR